MIAAILAFVKMFLFISNSIHLIYSFLICKVKSFKDNILIPTYHSRVVDDLDMRSRQVLQQVSQGTITRSIQQEYSSSTFDTQ